MGFKFLKSSILYITTLSCHHINFHLNDFFFFAKNMHIRNTYIEHEKSVDKHIIHELVTCYGGCLLCFGPGYRLTLLCTACVCSQCNLTIVHDDALKFVVLKLKAQLLFFIMLIVNKKEGNSISFISCICLSFSLAFFPTWPQNSKIYNTAIESGKHSKE